MSRRVRNDEIELGSDSFLDIIANIVGILIILIVIAGVKVARQPLFVESAVIAEPKADIVEPPVVVATIDQPEPVVVDSARREPTHFLPQTPPPITLVSKSQDVSLPKAAWDGSFDQKESAIRQYAQRSESMRNSIRQLTASHQQASATIDSQMQQATLAQSELAEARKRIEQQRTALGQLRRLLAMPTQPDVNITQIEHRITPVGKDVRGTEVHFRIADGLVSYVPVNELVEELKQDASRKQSNLMRNPSYRGSVGPIRGYRMKYTIARKSGSLVDDIAYGGFRVVVDEWEVEPTHDVEQETPTQALTPGSLFDRRLATLPRDANVTFWVYPKSFRMFRTLQQRVHKEGLTVAGRPLPFGVSIAGSPNGTKSSGQ